LPRFKREQINNTCVVACSSMLRGEGEKKKKGGEKGIPAPSARAAHDGGAKKGSRPRRSCRGARRRSPGNEKRKKKKKKRRRERPASLVSSAVGAGRNAQRAAGWCREGREKRKKKKGKKRRSSALCYDTGGLSSIFTRGYIRASNRNHHTTRKRQKERKKKEGEGKIRKGRLRSSGMKNACAGPATRNQVNRRAFDWPTTREGKEERERGRREEE